MKTRPYLQFLDIIIFAFFYGVLEAYIYDNGFIGGKYIFYKISWYHIFAVAVFTCAYIPLLIINWENIKYIPFAPVVQDATFFIFSNTKNLDQSSWVNHGLGGFLVFGYWLPATYLVGVIVGLFLIWLFRGDK